MLYVINSTGFIKYMFTCWLFSFIILTHTRRAKYAFNKVAKYLNYDMEIRVYGVKATQFFNYNRDNWWKNPYLFSHFMVVGMKFIIYILANNNVSFIKQI